MDNKELIRCPACGGTKKIIGLGMVERKCDECNGVGFVDMEDAEIIESVNGHASKPVVVTKRRGRPKREIEDGSR